MQSTLMRIEDESPRELAWRARAESAEAAADACRRCVVMLAEDVRAQRARADALEGRLVGVHQLARHAIAHARGDEVQAALCNIAVTAGEPASNVVRLRR